MLSLNIFPSVERSSRAAEPEPEQRAGNYRHNFRKQRGCRVALSLSGVRLENRNEKMLAILVCECIRVGTCAVRSHQERRRSPKWRKQEKRRQRNGPKCSGEKGPFPNAHSHQTHAWRQRRQCIGRSGASETAELRAERKKNNISEATMSFSFGPNAQAHFSSRFNPRAALPFARPAYIGPCTSEFRLSCTP